MAKTSGFDFLLKLGDGGGTEVFTTVGNCTTNSLDINNESIDVTDKSGNHFRELIDGGIISLSTSAEAMLNNDAQQMTMLGTLALSASANKRNYQIVCGVGTFQGSFRMTKFSLTGAHNGAQTASISLESAGTVTFTAA
jgi:predicted secreted protein